MTDETFRVIVVAFITGLPATIAALAALLQGRKNGRKVAENTVMTQATNDKIEAVADVTDTIHTNTNGNLDALKTKNAALVAENQALRAAAKR